MPTQPVVRPVIRAVVGSVIAALEGLRRFVYSFDGVDDRGVLQTAIDLEGSSFVLAFTCTNNATVGTFNRIIGSALNDAFRIYMGAGHTAFTLKTTRRDGTDSFRSLAVTPPQAGETVKYAMTFSLRSLDVYDVTTTRTSLSTGEVTVATVTGVQTSLIQLNHIGQGLSGAIWNGQIYDVEINGTLWPIADRNQSIQLPQPSGLGAELITPTVLENPFIKGSQWTYLGDGRWQYVGDGSLNELTFINPTLQPEQAFLEFEIESITGQLSCVQASSAISRGIFNSAGVKRYFYTNKNEASTNGGTVTFKRPAAGVITSCIIKNISFKPLGSCNPLTLVNTNPDRWSEQAV